MSKGGTIIAVDNLWKTYTMGSEKVHAIQGISLEIKRNEYVALMGPSGSGKSTLMNVLYGLYQPDGGEILIDGQPQHFTNPKQAMARGIGMVHQHFMLVDVFTVAENIALGRGVEELAAGGADTAAESAEVDAAIREAGRRAGAEEFVGQLPQGYDNMLGRWFEGGRQLSGGQWQRLALARLYFRGGSVLIFDEPTSALDADAEYEVIETLRQQARGRIAVIVSHRFSTVRMAERIVVLEGGVITEQGTHEELLVVDGTYARMFNRQARGYLEGYED